MGIRREHLQPVLHHRSAVKIDRSAVVTGFAGTVALDTYGNMPYILARR
jgi:hypothetical protein